MKLNLLWKDKDNNIYKLGILYKENNIFKFDIYENNLKSAIKRGCFGIGNFNFLKMHNESEELFDFFKERIPNKDDPFINNLFLENKLKEYDEMELLKITKGQLLYDRYFLEET